VPGEPVLFALLPGPMGRLSVVPAGPSTGPVQVKPGEIVKFTIRLTPRAGAAQESVPDSAVHIEVRNPAGRILDYYGANLPMANGATEFSVSLALNDQAGVWRVSARETFSHQTASAAFVVTK
jgi:uncharacterized protein YfaS (alpha-2-macroglobulin family)